MFIGVQLDTGLAADMDRARGRKDRSQFVREAIAEKLRKMGMTVPDDWIYPPLRAAVVVAEEPLRYGNNGRQTVALVRTDVLGRVTFITPAFTRMCGYSLGQLRGKKPGAILRPVTEPRDLRAVEGFRRAIRERRRYQCTITNYDSRRQPYRVRIKMRPIFQRGECTGFEAVEEKLKR